MMMASRLLLPVGGVAARRRKSRNATSNFQGPLSCLIAANRSSPLFPITYSPAPCLIGILKGTHTAQHKSPVYSRKYYV